MPNWILKELLEEQIDRLIKSFEISEKIFRKTDKEGSKQKSFHNGEYGTYREAICEEFLSFLTPQSLGISTGFVISPNDEISKQCDIIIYDKNATPLIQTANKQRFFPIETVVAVGEIKSNLGKTKLKEACNKLALVKKIRSELKNPQIYNVRGSRKTQGFNASINLNDQITTFIICNEFVGYNPKNEKWFDDLYENSINKTYKHNMILSLNDGILIYSIDGTELQKISPTELTPEELKKKNLFRYSKFSDGIELDDLFMLKDDNNNHIKTFASYIFQGTANSTILFPDLVNYLGQHFE